MKKSNAKKAGGTLRLVVAIFFSVILVPVLLALVPAGGVAITASTMVSQERIEQIVTEAHIPEEIYEVLMEEVEARASNGMLKAEVIEKLAKDSVKQKDIDKLVRTFIDGVYNDKSKNIELDEVEERLQSNLRDICEESFDDLYSAWMYGTPSDVLTQEYIDVLFEDLKNGILSDYSGYGAADLEELEQRYDKKHGYGSFDDLVSDRIMEERWSYNSRVEDEIMNGVSNGVEQAEITIKDTIDSISDEKAVRNGIDIARTIGDNRIILNVLVYVLIFGIVIILLLLYKFRTAGFVVSAIPLLIGGAGCKIVAFVERMIMSWLDRNLVVGIVEEERYQNAISTSVRGVFEVLFSGLSAYGTIMLISGAGLIVVAIVCSVIRKCVCKHKNVGVETVTETSTEVAFEAVPETSTELILEDMPETSTEADFEAVPETSTEADFEVVPEMRPDDCFDADPEENSEVTQ